MAEWKLTVGMEIHVELETKTKMFCGCLNDPFGSEPNIHVCPVCYGLPGALPTLNKEAIAMVVRFGHAIHATIPRETFWARKNYFYPDLPKGYQISQSSAPLVQGGTIVIDGTEHHLHHAHLEEDAGKLMHATDKSHSLVNYNRAGVPLFEIVTEPDFHTAESAKRFCQELQRIMRTLKISSADMEKGRMRCEANISVSETSELGTKVEVKNINSFKSVEKAIQHEFDRQVTARQAGQTIIAETRAWNDEEARTVSMRSKETNADYRYFPEPDLPIVVIEAGESGGHILPEDQRSNLQEIGLQSDTIQAVIDKGGYDLVVNLAVKGKEFATEAANLLLSSPRIVEFDPNDVTEFLSFKKKVGWTSALANVIVKDAVERGQTLTEWARKIYAETDQSSISDVAREVLNSNPNPVRDYKAGKEAAFQFLVGQVMAKTKGRANIQQVRDELEKALKS